MASRLIVVESPAKARTIGKVLGKGYVVLASKGHVKDLPKKELGVDIEAGFEPEYHTIRGRGKDLDAIKKAAKNAESIYLAPDPDREGEAIAWHIAEELPKGRPVYRVLFNEITKRGIREGMDNPGELDLRKYNSHRARRVLDRLVGYKISPLLWRKVKYGLSAGRVQSVALRLVVDREHEIEAFVAEEYWNVSAALEADSPPRFKAKVAKRDGEKLRVSNGQEADGVREELLKSSFYVSGIEQKETSRRPAPPFITSTLQQEAYRRHRFPARKTMTIAQRLYEGIELGERGSEGLITYMRTDSVRVAQEALQAVREHIGRSYGKDFVPEQPNFYKSRKTAQEAHEAIRPTDLANSPDSVRQFLDADQIKLYTLVYNRFVASQMASAVFSVTNVDISAGPYTLAARGAVEVFPGFLRVYQEQRDEEDSEARAENGEAPLPPLSKGQALRCESISTEQKFTQPPGRYTESTLIRELEARGVGRPSTYAAIISTILEKGYVRRDKGSFSPTDLGRVVTELLIEAFPEILDVEFTAQMEDGLDDIEEGRKEWNALLSEFYGPFSDRLSKATQAMANLKLIGHKTEIACDKCGAAMGIKFGRSGEYLACTAFPKCRNTKRFKRREDGAIVVLEDEPTDLECEKCGSPMIKREGRWGPYYACSNYPACKNIVSARKKSIAEPAPDDVKCPECGSQMLIRRSRAGNRFYACSRYPKCKGTTAIPVEIKCPKCGGLIVERRAKGRGRRFYGCENYPECDFASPYRPKAGPCPECGGQYLAEKYENGETVIFCPNPKCDHAVRESEQGNTEQSQDQS